MLVGIFLVALLFAHGAAAADRSWPGAPPDCWKEELRMDGPTAL